MNEEAVKGEKVNHPAHYQGGNGIEVIDVIEAFDLDFKVGNCVKYLLRAGKKHDEDDAETSRLLDL